MHFTFSGNRHILQSGAGKLLTNRDSMLPEEGYEYVEASNISPYTMPQGLSKVCIEART